MLVTQWEDWIVGDMMVGLMHQDPQGRPIPAACEGFTTSEDGLTHTVRLREHSWSDGVPVTADDYVFALRRLADPAQAPHVVAAVNALLDEKAPRFGQ